MNGRQAIIDYKNYTHFLIFFKFYFYLLALVLTLSCNIFKYTVFSSAWREGERSGYVERKNRNTKKTGDADKVINQLGHQSVQPTAAEQRQRQRRRQRAIARDQRRSQNFALIRL